MSKPLLANDQLNHDYFVLIGEDGSNYGSVNVDQARWLALEQGLDLVLVNPNATQPVVRLIDYGKFLYEQEKKEKRQRARQHAGELKEIKLSFKIDEHDFQTKLERAKGFLDAGMKVKVFLQLHGRENIFADKALAIIRRFQVELEADYESEPQKVGNRYLTILRKRKGS